MNKVILTGNLATEPEYRQTENGVSRAQFRLAVQRKYKNPEGKYDVDFLTVVCWRGLAEMVTRYMRKGERCGVVGTIQTRAYQDRNNTKHTLTEIIADEVEFLSTKKENAGQAQENAAGFTAPPREAYEEVEDDELPF